MHILVLHPVSSWQLQRVLEAARKHHTLVSIVTINGSQVARGMAGIEEWIRVDALSDDTESLKRLLRDKYTAVMAGNEFAVIAADQLAQSLGLYHNDIEKIKASRDKARMRQAFTKAGVLQPRVLAVVGDVRDSLVFDLPDNRYPVIVKTTNMAMSLFVGLCRSRVEIETHLAKMADFEKSKLTNYKFAREALIEEFVGGEEYSFEVVIESGKIVLGALTRKFVSPLPSCYEIGHLSGAALGPDASSTLSTFAEQIAFAWGMLFGVMHLEFKLHEGRIYVIEAGARPAGDLIPILVEMKYGFSLEEAALLCRHGGSVGAMERRSHSEHMYGVRFEYRERKCFETTPGIKIIRDSRNTYSAHADSDYFSTSRRTGHVIIETQSLSAAEYVLGSI